MIEQAAGISVNMNARCRVRLTEYGRKVRGEFYANLRLPCPPVDELEDQLWCLMQMFGPAISIGMSRVPFVDNRIEVLESL